jgi:hypothetical protein
MAGRSAVPSEAAPSASAGEAANFEATLPHEVAGHILNYDVLSQDEYRTSYLISSQLRAVIEDLAEDPDDVPVAYARTPADPSLSIAAIVFGERVPNEEVRQALLDLFVSDDPWTNGEVGGKEVASTQSEDGMAYVYVSEGVAYLVLADDPASADEVFRHLPA